MKKTLALLIAMNLVLTAFGSVLAEEMIPAVSAEETTEEFEAGTVEAPVPEVAVDAETPAVTGGDEAPVETAAEDEVETVADPEEATDPVPAVIPAGSDPVPAAPVTEEETIAVVSAEETVPASTAEASAETKAEEAAIQTEAPAETAANAPFVSLHVEAEEPLIEGDTVIFTAVYHGPEDEEHLVRWEEHDPDEDPSEEEAIWKPIGEGDKLTLQLQANQDGSAFRAVVVFAESELVSAVVTLHVQPRTEAQGTLTVDRTELDATDAPESASIPEEEDAPAETAEATEPSAPDKVTDDAEAADTTADETVTDAAVESGARTEETSAAGTEAERENQPANDLIVAIQIEIEHQADDTEEKPIEAEETAAEQGEEAPTTEEAPQAEEEAAEPAQETATDHAEEQSSNQPDRAEEAEAQTDASEESAVPQDGEFAPADAEQTEDAVETEEGQADESAVETDETEPGESTEETEQSAESGEDESAETEETVAAEEAEASAPAAMRISVNSLRDGDEVTLVGELEGFDGYELQLQWQVDKGEGFESVEGATGLTHRFSLSPESLNWDWRLVVYYRS